LSPSFLPPSLPPSFPPSFPQRSRWPSSQSPIARTLGSMRIKVDPPWSKS
jgi:hypothetical protein